MGSTQRAGGALPGIIGADLECQVRQALGALPGVVVQRNPVMRATLPTGVKVLTGLGGVGAPDLHVEITTHAGLVALVWMECKAGSGRLSKDQRAWREAHALGLGARNVVVIRDVGHALDVVERVRAGEAVR